MSTTIDITDIVAGMTATWPKLVAAEALAAIAAIPGLQWVALPGLSSLFTALMTQALRWVARRIEMQAFYRATAIRKALEASDYAGAVERRRSLPPTATREEYQRAEQAEMAAFRALVMVA